MKGSGFFAMLWRMRYISRWGLMRNVRTESLSEHTLDVAYLVHGLAAIGNARLGKSYDSGRLVMYALYHDTPEIITGDMPTPVKYYNKELMDAYKSMENAAAKRLLSLLPEDLHPEFRDYYNPGEDERLILKAADKLSALIKCMEEIRAGNHEFDSAYQSTLKSIREMNLEECEIFINEFLPAYGLTLDELSGK